MAKTKKKEKLNLEYIFLCDYAFTATGNKPGIIGIFDLLGVNKIPAGHPQMFLLAQFKGKENAEHALILKVIDPKGNEIKPSQGATPMKMRLSGTGRGTITHRFINFPLASTGSYNFALYEKNRKLGETKLSVMKVGNNGKSSRETN